MFSRFILPIAALAALSMPALAANGTADEAKALMERAAAHFEKAGAEQALKDFTNTGGEFVDRDLYVFCFNLDAVTTAHGGNPALMGKDISKLKDADGKSFTLEILDVAVKSGTGQVDYKWVNPTSKKIEQKSTYVQRLGDNACGVGFYKA